MHKVQNNIGSSIVINSIRSNDSSARHTRHSYLIRKPKIRISSTKKSFIWAGPTVYNKIPDNIKNSYLFKKSLKQYLNSVNDLNIN